VHHQKQKYYNTLEVDVWQHEKFCLFTHIIEKQGEIFSYAWGKRNTHTAQKLRNRLKSLGLSMMRFQLMIEIVFKESGLQKE